MKNGKRVFLKCNDKNGSILGFSNKAHVCEQMMTRTQHTGVVVAGIIGCSVPFKNEEENEVVEFAFFN